MRVKIDASRCAGHARCMAEAPQVFGYEARTNTAYLLREDAESDRAAVDLAILACPEQAISWTGESDD